MTNKEYRERHLIGTRIKYKGYDVCSDAKGDRGKVGKIVGYESDNCPNIFLPQSKHISYCSSKSVPVTWQTVWKNIEILPQKNVQLVFDFMR